MEIGSVLSRVRALPRTLCAHRVQLARHLFCLLGVPMLLLLFSQAITLQGFSEALNWMLRHGEAVLLTLGFLAAAQLFLRAVLGEYTVSTALLSLLFVLLSLVNYYKTVINGFPLMLCDFSLLTSARDIVSYAMPRVHISAVTGLSLLGALALVSAAHFLCRTRFPRRLPSRAAFLLLSAALPLLLTGISGAFQERTAALVQDCGSQEERLARCGTVYGLYAAYASGAAADYSAYTEETVAQLKNTLYLARQESGAEETASRPPHILMILSESFFDITRLEGVEFSESPLPNFQALSAQGVSGRFLSSTYAGGTGNVELETLTGINGSLLKESDALTALRRSDGNVYEALPSVARDAKANGYQTCYLHAHNDALYNRAEIMPALGFDTVVFCDDFETPVGYSGGYVSDDTLVSEVIRRFEEREEGRPVFMQITSMENHQPFTAGKYAEGCGIECRSERLGEEELAVLGALVTGLNHADAALGRLAAYFEELDEPVLIVFYGDHLPSMILSDDVTLYSALGLVSTVDTLQWTSDELCTMLSTDYLIWTNDGELTLPGRTESSVLLGADVLARAGLRRSAYFSWLSGTAGQSYLLWRPRLFAAADGALWSEVPEEYEQLLNAQRMMQYDLIYGEQDLAAYVRTDGG